MGDMKRYGDDSVDASLAVKSHNEENHAEYQQARPYVRNPREKNRWNEIARDNKLMQARLKNIKREPPATYHAPLGYGSIREGKRSRAGMRTTKMPGTNHYVPPVAWPPLPAPAGSPRSLKLRALTISNAGLEKKLKERYRARSDSDLVKTGQGRPVDCNELWPLRTSLYDGPGYVKPPSPRQYITGPARPASARASVASSRGSQQTRRRPASAAANGIPKSLGVAACAGCGRKSFYNADGVELFPCSKCGEAWYCSELCARVDWTSHKNRCTPSSVGSWAPTGVRPTGDCWVTDAAQATARQLLRKHHAAAAANGTASGGRLSSEHHHSMLDGFNDVAQQMQEIKLQDLIGEELQRRIEKNAAIGMDGPRPCMYTNGAPVAGHSPSAQDAAVVDKMRTDIIREQRKKGRLGRLGCRKL